MCVYTKQHGLQLPKRAFGKSNALSQSYSRPDKVTIDLHGMSASGATTLLTDAVGKPLLQNAHRVVGASLLEIDMRALPPGLYLIGLQTQEAFKVIKVIKQ